MVEMQVAEQDVHLPRGGGAELGPERRDPGPGIDHEQARAAPDLDAGGMAAELHELRAGCAG
jgi:hypothetical protein